MKKPKISIRLSTILLWLAVIIAASLIAGMILLPQPTPDEIEKATVPDLVKVLSLEPRDIVQSIVLPGQVVPNRSVMLAAELGGLITELSVDKGDRVSAGDVMARIDHRNWEAQFRQAQIEAMDAQRDFERWQSMQAEGAVSQSEFDAVKRRMMLTSIAQELAQIQMDKSIVKAPFDGIVDDRFLETGAFVNEGQALFQLLSPSPLKVSFHVPEKDVAILAMNDELTIHATAIPDHPPIKARITYLGRQATAPTFSYPAELVIEQPSDKLRPGMIVNVEMNRAVIQNALVLPLTAIVPLRGEHVVFVYREGIAERTVVWIEMMLGNEAVIQSGLEPGDLVIISGQRTLQDGAAVEIEKKRE